MVKRNNELRELIFAALCCVLGLLSKKMISPATNILTDFVRMPGGGTSGGIAMSFLVLGAAYSRRIWMGSLMGFLQALLALALGMAGYQGIFALITFTIPGAAIDVAKLLWKGKEKKGDFFVTACFLASSAAAVASNFLVFRFSGMMFLLWIGLAACAGILGGFIAFLLYEQLKKILKGI